MGKKKKLLIMTTCKKVFLKYQPSARFLSLCFEFGNAIFELFLLKKIAITQ